ncbi:MAG: DNA sulfur modification protein DndB [Actinomycetota bacterium]
MAIQPTFDQVLFSQDGGEEVVEMVMSMQDIVDLHKTGRLHVENARPMHARKTLKSGRESYTGTDSRLKNWTDQLNRNKGVLGNLSWNFDPDDCEVELDRKNGRLTLKSGTITTPDSATRHRAIIDASNATPPTIDLSRKVSVRGWFVRRQHVDDIADELTFEQVFDSYNQDGKPVNATVAKYNFQRDEIAKLVRAVFEESPHLGLDNVETVQNSISKSSSKLCAYNTLHTGFDTNWKIDLNNQADLDREVKWVVAAFDALVEALPDGGRVGKAAAQKLRDGSVIRSAVLVHAYIALLCQIRDIGGSPDEYFRKLPGTVKLEADSTETVLRDGKIVPRFREGDEVDFFSYGNPLWQKTGLLLPNEDKKTGVTKMGMFNARQQRNAVTAALRARVGLPEEG